MISRVWEMTKNTWGRFPERGKWQKIRGDDFLSVGNDIFYGRTVSQAWEIAFSTVGRFPECRKSHFLR